MIPTGNPEVPNGWILTRIGDAGQVTLGQQKGRASSEQASYPYLRVANVQDDELDLSDLAEMPISDTERYSLASGDVLVCEGQSRELVGRAAIYRGEHTPLFFQNTLIRFRANPGVEPEYALFVLRWYQKAGVFASIAKSTTSIAHLGLSRFQNVPFLVPPLEQQQQIAATARAFQAGIDQIRSTIDTCTDAARAILPEAVDAAILGSNSQTWRYGGTGESAWPLLEAQDVVASDAPIVYGILQPGPDTPDGVPYVRGQDLQQGYILSDQLKRASTEIARRYDRSKLAPGDVLLGIIRSTRVATVPESLAGANITQGTARLRPGPAVLPTYLAHWLGSRAAQHWLRSRMRGIDMPGLNLKDVRSLPIPVPPIPVQERIVEYLDAVALHADVVQQASRNMSSVITQLERSGLGLITRAELVMRPENARAGTAISLGASDLEQTQNQSAAQRRSGNARATARSGGAIQTTPEKVVNALQALSGSASPEELFTRLRLDEQAVDSYYIVLRELIQAGEIRTLRRNKSEVLIELIR